MTNANLSTLSLSALKALAAESGVVEVTGDKRSKQTWILAIESATVVATPDEDTLDDTFDLDGWDAPTISDAEMEAIAYTAAKFAAGFQVDANTPERSEQFWISAVESFQADAEATIADIVAERALEQTAQEHIETTDPAPAPKKVLNHKSANSAVLIFGTLVCVLVLVFRVAFGMGAIAFKLGSYVVRLFGKYDPNLDLGWQFSQFRRQRLVPALAQ